VGPLGTEQRFFVTEYPTGSPTQTPTATATATATASATSIPSSLRYPTLSTNTEASPDTSAPPDLMMVLC
jgi:hypothetical protein